MRHGGQRPFAFRRKQAFGLQLFVEGVESHLGRTGAEGAHIVHIQLERAVPLIDRGVAVGQHLHAVLGLKIQQPRLVAEHDALHAGGLVLQGKIQMAALVVAGEARKFPTDDQVVQRFALGQHLPGQTVERRYVDEIGHAFLSLAASNATPMALSLAYFPGTNRAPGRRRVT